MFSVMLLFSCETTQKEKKITLQKITNVEIETIATDSISIRALAVTPDHNLVYGGLFEGIYIE